jgi:hypothetical protein
MPPPPDDPLAPYDLSQLCDGRRTDFPLGMLVESVKVMLNDIYLQERLDFLLAHKQGESRVELSRAPAAGTRLIALRVPARESARAVHSQKETVRDDVPPYDELPRRVKDNIPRERWPLALHQVIYPGQPIPDSARYINLKNGLIFEYELGQRADGPLLPVSALGALRAI